METKKEVKKESKFNLPKPELNSGSGKASLLIPKMKESGLTTEEAMKKLSLTSDKRARQLLREALVIGVKQGLKPVLLRAGSSKRYCLVNPPDFSEFKKVALNSGYTIEEKLPKAVARILEVNK